MVATGRPRAAFIGPSTLHNTQLSAHSSSDERRLLHATSPDSPAAVFGAPPTPRAERTARVHDTHQYRRVWWRRTRRSAERGRSAGLSWFVPLFAGRWWCGTRSNAHRCVLRGDGRAAPPHCAHRAPPRRHPSPPTRGALKAGLPPSSFTGTPHSLHRLRVGYEPSTYSGSPHTSPSVSLVGVGYVGRQPLSQQLQLAGRGDPPRTQRRAQRSLVHPLCSAMTHAGLHAGSNTIGSLRSLSCVRG